MGAYTSILMYLHEKLLKNTRLGVFSCPVANSANSEFLVNQGEFHALASVYNPLLENFGTGVYPNFPPAPSGFFLAL